MAEEPLTVEDTEEFADINDAIQNFNEDEELNRVEITIAGRDYYFSFEQIGLSMDSSHSEIMEAVRPIIEETDRSIDDEYGEVSYTSRKSTNTNVIHVYPKPVAGPNQ